MARDRSAGLESRQVDRPDCFASRGGALGVETFSPPLCLHCCQGLEDGAALGGTACRIASVFARHPHGSCSAADLKDHVGRRKISLLEAATKTSKGEVHPKSVRISAPQPLMIKPKPFCNEN